MLGNRLLFDYQFLYYFCFRKILGKFLLPSIPISILLGGFVQIDKDKTSRGRAVVI